jgi:hypothetical protein
MLKVVDLPAPFGPRSPKIYPLSIPKDVPLTATYPLAYIFPKLFVLTESVQAISKTLSRS